MCSQFAVGSGRLTVSEARGREDSAALDAGLEALLFEREALEGGEGVGVCGALVRKGRLVRDGRDGVDLVKKAVCTTYVYDGVFQYPGSGAVVPDCAFPLPVPSSSVVAAHTYTALGTFFEIPARSLLVVSEFRAVIAFVQKLED